MTYQILYFYKKATCLFRLRKYLTDSHSNRLHENTEHSKLQREVKEKVQQLQRLESKYQNLDDLLKKVKLSHTQVLEEMEAMTNKLKVRTLLSYCSVCCTTT